MIMKVSPALAKDVVNISSIIKIFSGKNSLLPKKEDELYLRLNDIFVLRSDDDEVIGCASIYIYSQVYSEICSLAILPQYQNNGGGILLLNAIREKARFLGIEKLFTLTYVAEFFKKNGFVEIDKDLLPHKIWKDCIKCKYFPKCNEIALICDV